MENGERRLRRCSRRSDLMPFGPGPAVSVSKHLWALRGAYSRAISRPPRCCVHGSDGYAKSVCDSTCLIDGLAGSSRGLAVLRHQSAFALLGPVRWYLPLETVAWPD